MIAVSDTVRSIIDGGTFTARVQVQSWLGDQLLADDVPVTAATEESDSTLTVPERITLTVPKRRDGIDWTPVNDDDPLKACGQTLKISIGVSKGADGMEFFQRGEYLIQETEENDDGLTLSVTCVGLLALIDEAKFAAPFQPSGTIVSTIRQLVEPALTLNLDDAPADRSVPASAVNWDSDRLGALGELLDAWPAVLRMNAGGWADILPDAVPTAADAVRSFTNGSGGTVIAAGGSSSRDGGFNVVVATGQAADGGEVRGQAIVTNGAWAYGLGPANPLPVPFGYSSPLLTTVAQCTAAAQTVLRRKMREAVLRRFTITAMPDPTIELGDPVLVTTDHVTGLLCTVEAIPTLPYFPGSMQLKVVSTV